MNDELEAMAGEQTPAPTLKSVNVTQVSNGFITEVSASSARDQDAQERATIHTDIDALTSYLKTLFV